MPPAVPRQPAWSSATPRPGASEVDRNAIGDGDREEHARRAWSPSRPRHRPGPTRAPVPTVSTTVPCTWSPSTTASKPDIASAEGAPAAHDFADWRLAPEAEVEPASRPGAAPGDAGDDATTAPGGELVERERSRARLFAEDDGCAGVIPRGGSEDPGGRRAMAVRLPRPRSGWVAGQSSMRSISAPSARSRSSIRS